MSRKPPRRDIDEERAHRPARQGPRRRPHRGGGGHEARDRADGRATGDQDPAQAQPGRRLRLPGLRLAGPVTGAPAHRGVLRERRQGGHRGGDPAPHRPRVLRRAPARRAGRQDRLLAGPAGPDRRADGAARGRHPLRADHLGRCVRAGRRAPARAGQPGRGDLLHLRQDVQRGGVRLPAVRPRSRHQQPARLLEHVPRVHLGGAGRGDRHRQGLGLPRRRPQRRADRDRRPEPRHQPPADALGARAGQEERRQDRVDQPAARGRAGAVQEPSNPARRDRPRHRARRPAPADPGQRRPRAVPGHRRAAAGVGRRRPRSSSSTPAASRSTPPT